MFRHPSTPLRYDIHLPWFLYQRFCWWRWNDALLLQAGVIHTRYISWDGQPTALEVVEALQLVRRLCLLYIGHYFPVLPGPGQTHGSVYPFRLLLPLLLRLWVLLDTRRLPSSYKHANLLCEMNTQIRSADVSQFSGFSWRILEESGCMQ